jgi:hypothetical protein
MEIKQHASTSKVTVLVQGTHVEQFNLEVKLTHLKKIMLSTRFSKLTCKLGRAQRVVQINTLSISKLAHNANLATSWESNLSLDLL